MSAGFPGAAYPGGSSSGGTWPPPGAFPAAPRPPGRPRRDPAERARLRRRRWLLWGSAPVWIAVLVLAAATALGTADARTGQAEFQREQHPAAVRTFERVDDAALVVPGWFEGWKAPYDLGTARSGTGDWWGALDDLDRALDLVPEDEAGNRCLVQINRAVVLEAWGDEELADSRALQDDADALERELERDPDAGAWTGTTPEDLRAEARELAAWAERDYADAQEAREDPACSQQPPPEQQQNDDSKDRLEQKQDEADDASKPEETPDGQPEPSTPEEEEARRQEELAERNDQAESDAEAERQEQGEDGSGGSKDW